VAGRGIEKDQRPCHARRDLLEQRDPLRTDTELEQGKARGVATRPGQARDKARPDRIGDLREHDRHGAGGRQQRSHDRSAYGQDGFRRER
jgi:hypothetical protein